MPASNRKPGTIGPAVLKLTKEHPEYSRKKMCEILGVTRERVGVAHRYYARYGTAAEKKIIAKHQAKQPLGGRRPIAPDGTKVSQTQRSLQTVEKERSESSVPRPVEPATPEPAWVEEDPMDLETFKRLTAARLVEQLSRVDLSENYIKHLLGQLELPPNEVKTEAFVRLEMTFHGFTKSTQQFLTELDESLDVTSLNEFVKTAQAIDPEVEIMVTEITLGN